MDNNEILLKTLEKENKLLKENMATIRQKDLEKYNKLESENKILKNNIENLKDENKKIREQLDSILYSRSYKMIQKVKKILGR